MTQDVRQGIFTLAESIGRLAMAVEDTYHHIQHQKRLFVPFIDTTPEVRTKRKTT
jgi:hypothetical protein